MSRAHDPHAVALIDRRGSVTAIELGDAVARLRGTLQARSVTVGDHVVIVTANERESVIAYHSTVQLGAVAVLTQLSAGLAEFELACALSAPRLVLVTPAAESVRSQLTAAVPVLRIDELDGDPAGAPPHVDGDRPRVVVFTSGTTSTPKGVVHTASSLRSAVANFHDMTRLDSGDRVFLISPLASITGVLQVLELAPSVGAAVVLESSWNEQRTMDLLSETESTFYGGPDIVLRRLLDEAERRGIQIPLRIAALGGTMLRHELIDAAERAGIHVVRVYGSSEAPCSTGSRPDEPDADRLYGEGRPGRGVELRIADDGSDELLVRGPHVFHGYLDASQDHDSLAGGWYRTGDSAEFTNGRLRIIGRLKEIASRNALKISLAEVEEAFARASGLTECAAFSVADEETGEHVTIAVHVAGDVQPDVERTLRAMEAAGLARWKLPECVVRTREPLPMTPTGKVQRRLLVETAEVIWAAPRLSTR